MIVFIDGENFRQRLSDCLLASGRTKKSENFKYDVAGLLREVLNSNDLDIRYYASEIKTPVGYVPAKRVQKQINNIRSYTRKWVADIKNQGINYIKAGNLKVKEGKPCYKCRARQEHLQEKGVDVRISLDIFEASLDKNTKEIAVFSSDTDLCPAYHKIKKYGTTVKYLCFAPYLNRAVSAATTETITITAAIAAKFLKNSEL
ncbi:NYN domain-containing protein [Candidatus Saccharibacteria bacterium]|nr:NYN domain-containing protein [Candidatus Saccharibacteria bacterium]